MKHIISGHWRIIWMEEWDQDYIDLVEAGFIKISSDGSGEFLFGGWKACWFNFFLGW